MNLKRTIYRTNQFWSDLKAAPDSADLDQARLILNPDEFELFLHLQPAEQAHALKVLHKVQANGGYEPALLKAALLHDIGKTRAALHRWERVLVVLVKAVFPAHAAQWGDGEARGWRKPFAVANQHPAWGADLASRAGASPLVVTLIRRHQETLLGEPRSVEEHYLQTLQQADDAS
jgi:hypothetical protein